MRLLPAGPRSVLVEVASTEQVAAVLALVQASGTRVSEAVPAARTVLLEEVEDLPALTALLTATDLSADLSAGHPVGGSAGAAPLVELPTVYDGADLADVARLWGCSPEEAVELHAGTEFVVAFCGFVPGFVYCTGLPEELAVPRLPRPRSRVPAGSVAVADAWTGVYPTASPGGWRLLGHTEVTLWDPAADPPALLPPGSRVRFRAVRR